MAAGSNKGEHRGGRKKGTPNQDKRELIDMIQEKFPKYHPLMALAEIANDEKVDDNLKFQASKEVCRYIVPQLKAIELTGGGGGPVKVQIYQLPDGTEIEF